MTLETFLAFCLLVAVFAPLAVHLWQTRDMSQEDVRSMRRRDAANKALRR